jgi:hypothetical protein
VVWRGTCDNILVEEWTVNKVDETIDITIRPLDSIRDSSEEHNDITPNNP